MHMLVMIVVLMLDANSRKHMHAVPLLVQVIAQECSIPEAELQQRVASLLHVVPDLGGRLAALPPATLVST